MDEFFKKYDFLNQGHILGLGFEEGVLFFEIMAREPKYFVYDFEELGPGEAMSEWSTLPRDNNRNYIEPVTKKEIYHIYFGIKPTSASIYLRFPSGVDRWTFIDPVNPSSQNGALAGEWTPFESPSIMTELITLKDVYPAFKIKNNSDEIVNPKMRIIGMAYEYLIVSDKKLIEDYLTLKRRSKIYFLGGVEPHVRAPEWLVSIRGVSDLLKYSKEVLDRVSKR